MSEQPKKRRRWWILPSLVLLAVVGVFAFPFVRYAGQGSPIDWVSYERGVELAKSTGKPLFIDVSAKW